MDTLPGTPEPKQASRAESQHPATVWELFLLCLKVGSLSFGGGLSGWLFREFVARKHWVSEDDFLSTLTLVQMLPGAFVVNLVVCLGEQLRGPSGAVACLMGFMLPPIISVVALLELLKLIPPSPYLDATMVGVTFAALGFLLQVAWAGLRRVGSSVLKLCLVTVLVACITVLEVPIIVAVLVAIPVGVLMVWRESNGD